VGWKQIGLLLVLCLSGGAAHGEFISMDSEFGAGTITLDTSTGLEWLDPYQTLHFDDAGLVCCQTFESISSNFGVGGKFEGFQFATRSQLEDLFYVSAGYLDSSSAAEVATIFDYFGTVEESPFFTRLSGFYDTGSEDYAGVATVFEYFGNADVDLIDDLMRHDELNDTPHGGWLIRAPQVVAVSEPGSILFVIVSTLLVLQSRRPLKS